MIEFHAPTPADKAWVDELLARGNYRGCDYNFTNLYVWSRAYNQRIARVDDFLVTHVCGRLGCSYMYPAGSGDIAAVIRALEADAAEKGEPLRLVCLTPRQMAELEEFFPGLQDRRMTSCGNSCLTRFILHRVRTPKKARPAT